MSGFDVHYDAVINKVSELYGRSKFLGSTFQKYILREGGCSVVYNRGGSLSNIMEPLSISGDDSMLLGDLFTKNTTLLKPTPYIDSDGEERVETTHHFIHCEEVSGGYDVYVRLLSRGDEVMLEMDNDGSYVRGLWEGMMAVDYGI